MRWIRKWTFFYFLSVPLDIKRNEWDLAPQPSGHVDHCPAFHSGGHGRKLHSLARSGGRRRPSQCDHATLRPVDSCTHCRSARCLPWKWVSRTEGLASLNGSYMMKFVWKQTAKARGGAGGPFRVSPVILLQRLGLLLLRTQLKAAAAEERQLWLTCSSHLLHFHNVEDFF